MAPPVDPDLVKPIETIEEWNMICGDDAQKDMLFIVEVYAEWCGPSIAVTSTYKKIKDQNEQKKFKICKVCASLCGGEGEYLEKYTIDARPRFLLFKDGEQVAMVEGVSMPALEKLIGEQMPEGLLEDDPGEAADAEEED